MRRTRIDLGQKPNVKEEAQLERKRKRWAAVNKHRPEHENPFLAAIKPDHDNYGDPGETMADLKARLEGLEFGNYPGYFNYRNKAATSNNEPDEKKDDDATKEVHEQPPAVGPLDAGLSDERLGLMKEEWFRGKSVLDIGCNRGHITYAIAKLYSPQFILGIDIDLKMIHMANRDLHLHLESDIIKQSDMFRIERAYKLFTSEKEEEDDKNKKQQQDYNEDSNHFSLSSYVALGPLASEIPDESKTGNSETDDKSDDVKQASQFPHNILFVEHNYVLARDELVDKQQAYFDTIVCLSVTKWIHLNYRDEGLKRFLRRIHRHLKPGGLLVLEVQPYDNYYRKKKLSDRLRANYYSIKFKPEQIEEYLLSSEVGFREIIHSTHTEHECAGFKRPLKVFLK